MKHNILLLIFGILSFCEENFMNNNLPKLTSNSFNNTIPNTDNVFIFFYRKSNLCKACYNAFDFFYTIYNSKLTKNSLFYTLNGLENPSIIKRFIEIPSYPTIAFYAPNQTTISSIYSNFTTKENLERWIFQLINIETIAMKTESENTSDTNTFEYQYKIIYDFIEKISLSKGKLASKQEAINEIIILQKKEIKNELENISLQNSWLSFFVEIFISSIILLMIRRILSRGSNS